ncbi:MAG: TonB-dependent receptor, partial [Hymenobacteraceae bacterium]|nr:TonB-dependent receptor [Hymenobacteraceae bacterium]MDX5396984.1 TonB-dependent receptor [Hymenobacteraceae bacterium]MDX5513058.1 TonB-dependent receptor [Hymenobacteraceae bacterium]
PENKPFELTSRQTAGSFGLFNSFNSIGGSKGKVRYYSFFQYKRGDGWRPNSGFDVKTAFASVQYQATDKLEIGFDYTFMDYTAQQPGGLTDVQFQADPRQSVRERNWFKVNWNLIALTLDYRFTDRTRLNIRNFGLLAERDALGNLGKINRPDNEQLERLLLMDKFRNIGNETRLLHQYNFRNNLSTFVGGLRYYRGYTDQQQGSGPAGKAADFRFATPQPDQSAYDYLSQNIAFFAENVFNLSPRFSVTPGLRYEYIFTQADGYYNNVLRDFAGNILTEEQVFEARENGRGLLIGGLGISYKPSENLEAYGNFSQNYRAINFNDMRIVNANLIIDPNLKDEKGSSADLGVRGSYSSFLNFDVSFFHLLYANRISQIFKSGTTDRLRTNVGQARHVG